MKNPLGPFSLLFGAALGAIFLMGPKTAQTPQSLASIQLRQGLALQRSAWPPRPDTIVNVDSCNDPAGVGGTGCNITMLPGDEHVMYTVPANRFLVVTNFEEQTNWGGTDSLMQLVQNLQGTTTVMRGHDFSGKTDRDLGTGYTSPTGLVFQPGSDVVVRRTTSGIGAVALNYTLTGYLTP